MKLLLMCTCNDFFFSMTVKNEEFSKKNFFHNIKHNKKNCSGINKFPDRAFKSFEILLRHFTKKSINSATIMSHKSFTALNKVKESAILLFFVQTHLGNRNRVKILEFLLPSALYSCIFSHTLFAVFSLTMIAT